MLPRFTVGFLANQYKQKGSRGLSFQEKGDRVAASRILQQLYLRDSFLEADNSSRQRCADRVTDAEDGPLERDQTVISAKSRNSGVVASEHDVSRTLVASEKPHDPKFSTSSTTSVNEGSDASLSEWSSTERACGVDRLPPPVVQAGTESPDFPCGSSGSLPVGSEIASPAETDTGDYEVCEAPEHVLKFVKPVLAVFEEQVADVLTALSRRRSRGSSISNGCYWSRKSRRRPGLILSRLGFRVPQ